MTSHAMRRREFITLLGSAAASPFTAHAQQSTMPVIGFLHGASPDGTASQVAAFHAGLKRTGHVEGLNVAIEFRWAEGRYDRLPALAAELADRRPTVIAATGGIMSVLAAKAATEAIPIVRFGRRLKKNRAPSFFHTGKNGPRPPVSQVEGVREE